VDAPVSRPLNELSLDGATGTATGEEFAGKGHTHFTLFVIAWNIDTGSDTLTVELQHSPRGDTWTPLTSVTETDITGESASTSTRVATETVRASVTDFSDASGNDLSVDAYVLASGNTGLAQRGTGV
jgi:hypothetical protein